MRSISITVLTILTCVILILTVVTATTGLGTIKGIVLDDKTGKPIIGASVQVVGTSMGAYTDVDGRFVIKRLSPDTYKLKISAMGYSTIKKTDVVVTKDGVIELSFRMKESVSSLDKIVTVRGSQDILDIYQSDSKVVMSSEEMATTPVQTVDALLEQVAGVQISNEGEVLDRGGRAGDVSYILDGIPNRDPEQSSRINVEPNDYQPESKCRSNHSNRANTLTPEERKKLYNPTYHLRYGKNGEPYDAMYFKDHGVNPFINTSHDRFSTFAIDVDDASYTISRSYITRGHLPPTEAIRTEEFVNHFNYDYKIPENKAFEIILDGAPSEYGSENEWLLRVGIQGAEIQTGQRKPANIVFLIDVSGSMARENRLQMVKRSLRMFLDQLTVNDRVGIVTYSTSGAVVLRPTSIRERHRILNAIDNMRTGGSTNVDEGLRLAYQMANRMFESEKINRVILCSDGVANTGCTDPDELLGEIRRYSRKGITLSTIGFGMGNYNDVLLEKLGDEGNGNYAYVDDLEEAYRVFVENLTGMLQVIARDTKIQVEFDPGLVHAYRLLGYENRDVADNRFRDDNTDGGEIGSGHSVTALYELKLNSRHPMGDLGSVSVRFKDPVTDEVTEVKRGIPAVVFAGSFRNAPVSLRLAATAAEFAKILKGSYWANESDITRVLVNTSLVYSETGDQDVLELMNLVSRACLYGNELAKR